MEAVHSNIEIALKNVILQESSCKLAIKSSETTGGNLTTTFSFNLMHDGDELKVGDNFQLSLSIGIRAQDSNDEKEAFYTITKVEGEYEVINAPDGTIKPESDFYFWYLAANYICPYVAMYNKENMSKMGYNDISVVMSIPYEKFMNEIEVDKLRGKAKKSKPKKKNC